MGHERIIVMLSTKRERDLVEAALISDLEGSGVPHLIEDSLARVWGDPNYPEDPVEERQLHFSYLSPESRSGGVLQLDFTRYNPQGEQRLSLTYTDQGIKGGRILKVLGQDEFFNGPIPQNPEQTRIFVEALDHALNTPFRPLAFVGRSSRDLS